MVNQKNHELKMYRMACVFGFIFYPLFGYFYFDYYFLFDFDGFWERFPLGILSLIFLLFSYVSIVTLTSLRIFLLIGTVSITSHYFYLVQLSNYHWMFIAGLVQLPLVCIVTFYRKMDAILYFISVLVLSFIFLENSPFVGFTYPLLISTYLVIYYFYFSNRESLVVDLESKILRIQKQQVEIEEKNRSLIKIGELATQVAHDIRSPVTALEAVSKMLSEEVDPKKKKLIENAAKRINDIANNLVSNYRENLTRDLSSLKIDRIVNLNTLIEDIVEEKKLSLDSKHKITFRAPESIDVPDKISSVEFQRVISNLINNSIEAFDKEHGIVDIKLYKKDSSITITIRDNGKGILPDQILKVFEKGISGKPKGAGLGLSHAKECLESFGAKISIDSNVGKNTEVTIQL